MSKKLAIAMFGQKRLSREGGVEIVVKELCTRMAQNGCDVTCYNRAGHHVSGAEYDDAGKTEYEGIRQKSVPTIERRGLAAVSSSAFAALYSAFGKYDVVHIHLALGKRRNELKKTAGNTRSVLKKYPESFLDKNMYLFLALAIVFYALWSVDPVTIGFYGLAAKGLVWTVPILCLITLRYSFDVEGDSDGDPVEVVVHDIPLMLLCVVYAMCMFLLLYVLR